MNWKIGWSVFPIFSLFKDKMWEFFMFQILFLSNKLTSRKDESFKLGTVVVRAYLFHLPDRTNIPA